MDDRSTEALASEPTNDPDEALRRAERLFEVNVQLSAMRDPDALLRYIIEAAPDVLRCEAASVLLYDEGHDRLRFAAATGSNADELASVPVPLGDSLAGAVFTQDRPLVVGDVATDARHYDPASERVSFDARSLVGVPMRLEGTPVGVLEGLNKEGGAFTDEDVRALSILAAQAAVAIRNANQTQALEAANDRLSRLDELKSDFLALASHELRTPLSTVIGFGEIIQEQVGQEGLAEPAAMVMNGAYRMKEVVETMARMESLRNEAADLETRPMALAPILRRACNDAASGAAGAADRLALELREEELTVRGDRERLRLALVNVVENAFQFSPEGGPVTVRATREDEQAHVTVRDEGIGLTEAEHERIFEDFYQAEDALTRAHGGLGLGLTMARELTRLHDGRLRAASAGRGEGTTMHLHLPLA